MIGITEIQTFKPVSGFNADDLIKNRFTIVIYFSINGENDRRYFTSSYPLELRKDTPTGSKYIYTKFKEYLKYLTPRS
jgi:hypothetical protein